MRHTAIALTGLVLSACLVREEVGIERPAPDAGCGPSCDGGLPPDDPVREEVARVIDELSRGPWVGQATSGSVRVDLSFEFQKNGDYLARCRDERQAWSCFGLFPAVQDGTVRGRYILNADNLHGTYHGKFHDPLRGGVVNSDFTDLSLEGDTLRFTRRVLSVSLGPDAGVTGSVVFLDAHMVLERSL